MRILPFSLCCLAAFLVPASAWADSDDFFSDWSQRAHAALASEPHWIPALNTISPRLTQVMRYDQYWQSTSAPAALDNFGAGKGLEIIPADTLSITFNLPPYFERQKKGAASGWGDWPIALIKQRLFSAAPEDGDYVVTSYLSIQAPTGSQAFTNHAWLITPGLGFGKGWGDFDIQGGVTAALPTSDSNTIGTAIATNVVGQYHWDKYFWPEVELNDTTWSGGTRGGLNQLFMTVGTVFGNVPLFENYALGVGAGYQFALTAHQVSASALTPTYDHNWMLSLRLVY